jgi:Zn-dependent protease with chaperone function
MKMTSKAIFAITLFILVYLLLIVFAIGLTVLCVMGGIGLIILKPMLITFAVGLGLVSLGFLILIFLLKFLFKKHKTDLSHLTEITREQEPQLFKFIEEIVKEVETDFPKKIYLSNDVNACVFYDSSFWSMFFPIRKNLQIGIGLVNSVTEQEFKAILAHEFGHFSQKSMKVGSYVYNVNQVIFNMLFDNESFDGIIQSLANISSYFVIFVGVAVKIIQGIQWILKQMYAVINLSYMALSREMEFHADEVAANVTGYLPLKESLLRLDLANHSFNSVIGFYDSKISENKISKNIYTEQQYVMKFIAQENSIPFKNNLPLVSELELNKYNKSKLNIKDQWASHPSTEERIRALEQLNIVKEFSQDLPAIQLFANPKQLEESITQKMFSNVQYQDATTPLNEEEFIAEFQKTYLDNSFPKLYNGYYDNKNPLVFELESIQEFKVEENFEILFSKEMVDVIYDFVGLENDKNVLKAIQTKEIDVKTFDYEGQKYKSNDAQLLISQIETEIEKATISIKEHDIKIYKFFYSLALQHGKEAELKVLYADLFKHDKEFESKFEFYNLMIKKLNFISVVTPYQQIESNFDNLIPHEKFLKTELKRLLESKILEKDITPSIKESLEKYIHHDLEYFKDEVYLDENLKLLFDGINYFQFLISREIFLSKLNLLNFQVALLNPEN